MGSYIPPQMRNILIQGNILNLRAYTAEQAGFPKDPQSWDTFESSTSLYRSHFLPQLELRQAYWLAFAMVTSFLEDSLPSFGEDVTEDSD